MYEEISAGFSTANDAKIIKGERVTSARGVVVNSGRIIVNLYGALQFWSLLIVLNPPLDFPYPFCLPLS